MFRYVLQHRQQPHECGVVFAAFKGHGSALRHQRALASCELGEHATWWIVEAASEQQALGFLPFYLAERMTATRVTQIEIP